jgi:type VI secretion system secreted protein Hcp
MMVGIPLIAATVGLSYALSGSEATAQPTVGTGNLFLHIDGIPGESADAVHRNDIELLSYEWSDDGQPGLEQPAGSSASGAGGPGSGKVQAKAIRFSQNLSRASPLLMVAAADGRHFREATLVVRRGGERPLDYVTIKLTDVRVSSYGTSSTPSGTPTDEFDLTFGKVQYSYLPQNADGSSAPSVVGTWDFTTNSGG